MLTDAALIRFWFYSERIRTTSIEVIPWMTVHGNGSPKNAMIKEHGCSEYAIENVYFTMVGDWDLLINIMKYEIKDTVDLMPCMEIAKIASRRIKIKKIG